MQSWLCIQQSSFETYILKVDMTHCIVHPYHQPNHQSQNNLRSYKCRSLQYPQLKSKHQPSLNQVERNHTDYFLVIYQVIIHQPNLMIQYEFYCCLHLMRLLMESLSSMYLTHLQGQLMIHLVQMNNLKFYQQRQQLLLGLGVMNHYSNLNHHIYYQKIGDTLKSLMNLWYQGQLCYHQ